MKKFFNIKFFIVVLIIWVIAGTIKMFYFGG